VASMIPANTVGTPWRIESDEAQAAASLTSVEHLVSYTTSRIRYEP